MVKLDRFTLCNKAPSAATKVTACLIAGAILEACAVDRYPTYCHKRVPQLAIGRK